MGYRLLDTSQKDIWRHYWMELPVFQRDVYFLPEYYELYESDYIKAKCFIFKEGEKTAIYPFLMTSINDVVKFKLYDEYFDIEGAYGYNGIAVNISDRFFLDRFTLEFTNFCRRENIIAEFARFNPVFKNHELSSYMDIEKVSGNVLVDLSASEEDIWIKSYEHCARKNVNRAKASDLQVISYKGEELEEKQLDEFIQIYYSSMDRNEADKNYYFIKDYFRKLKDSLGKNSFFFFTLFKEKAVSCELVMFGEKVAYSFLGGTLSQFYPMRPNNLLKHEIILKFKSMGFNFYCIGGGLSHKDGIFRYKKAFSKNGVVDFCIGKKIHNAEAYRNICDLWEKKNPEKADKYKNYFLKYKF